MVSGRGRFLEGVGAVSSRGGISGLVVFFFFLFFRSFFCFVEKLGGEVGKGFPLEAKMWSISDMVKKVYL